MSNQVIHATQEYVENKSNIKKNPNATEGDIIDTHLTVGNRVTNTEEYTPYHSSNIGSFVSGGMRHSKITDENGQTTYEDIIGDGNVADGSNTAVVGGDKNRIQNGYGEAINSCEDTTNSVIIGGYDNYIESSSSCAIISSKDSKVRILGGSSSVILGGYDNEISTTDSIILGGHGNTVSNSGNAGIIVGGAYADSNYEDIFVLGNGISKDNRSNALRVTYNGEIYSRSEYGAEEKKIATEGYVNEQIVSSQTYGYYPEVFRWCDDQYTTDSQWADGRFVTLVGEQIRPATPDDDYILGVTTLEMGFNHPTTTWYACVRSMGKLVVVDDGTCEVNGYCKVGENGVATISNEKSNYRVMARLDDTHIKIILK